MVSANVTFTTKSLDEFLFYAFSAFLVGFGHRGKSYFNLVRM